jgi:oligoendopeptidase F
MLNNNEQLSLLDILNILSFIIGIMNYNENLTQGDKQDLMSEFDNKSSELLSQLHEHLENQDVKLNEIIERLEMLEHGSR